MDDVRFDALTKRLATAASRRQLITLLGGGLAAALGVVPERAHAGAKNCGVCNDLRPGERGRCTSSCAQSGGFPAGCTDVKQLCRSTSGTYTCCVGGERCVGGACAPASLGLGDACTDDAQCINAGGLESGKTFCSSNRCCPTCNDPNPTVAVCCVANNAAGCTTDCECCGTAACVGGVCTFDRPKSCVC